MIIFYIYFGLKRYFSAIKMFILVGETKCDHTFKNKARQKTQNKTFPLSILFTDS